MHIIAYSLGITNIYKVYMLNVYWFNMKRIVFTLFLAIVMYIFLFLFSVLLFLFCFICLYIYKSK